MKPIVIFGNSFGSLIAAIELGKQKIPTIVFSPKGPWAPHFRGKEIGGHIFDHGLNLFELTSIRNNLCDDILSYQAQKRNDVGRFVNTIRSYITKDLGFPLHQTIAPQIWVEEKWRMDFLLANHLEAITKMSQNFQDKMKADLSNIKQRVQHELHASHKCQCPERFLCSMEDASMVNHGKTFHNTFVEPMTQKVLNASASKTLALYHRLNWLPLFYPETLESQFHANPQRFSGTTFDYPKGGSFRLLTDHLARQAQEQESVKWVAFDKLSLKRTSTSTMLVNDQYEVALDRCVWNLDLLQLFRALGENRPEKFEKASLSIGYLVLKPNPDRAPLSFGFIVDQKLAPYRITNLNEMAGQSGDLSSRWIVELNRSYCEKLGLKTLSDISNEIMRSLLRLNVIESLDEIEQLTVENYDNVLMMATPENYQAFHHLRNQALERLPGIELLGASGGFGANSLNDQIAQGLWTGDAFTTNPSRSRQPRAEATLLS